MIPSILNFHPEAVSFDAESPEGIGLQAGIYGGLFIALICACCCVRRYCIRPPAVTDFIAEEVTGKENYGSVHAAASAIIHRRYESEIGHQPDTLSQREISILEQIEQEEAINETSQFSLPDESEYTIYDGSEPDLMEVSLTERGESDEKK